MRILVFVLGVLLLVSVPGLASPLVTVERYPVTGDIVSVELSGYNGTIEFSPIPPDQAGYVEVEKRVGGFSAPAMERYLEEITIEQQQRGSYLTLATKQPRSILGVTSSSVSFTLYAPVEQIKEFRARTSNGKIHVPAFDGKLDLRTSNGQISLKSVQGIVDAHTSNGAIDILDVSLTGSSSFRTSNGRIGATVRLAPGHRYAFETSNGAIELRIPTTTEGRFDLTTSNGSCTVSLGEYYLEGRRLNLQKGEASTSIRVSTSNGNIVLEGTN